MLILKGVDRPIFYQGEQVGEYRHYDERLTMFLLRYRRSHRYCELPRLPPIVPPPGCEDDGPDPDEAIGTLDFYLEDLVDQAELRGGVTGGPATIDGVNFVNFVGDDEPPSAAAPMRSIADAARRDGE